MTSLVVHHLNNSRSQRVLWLLEELGLPYEIVRYQRDARTLLAPPELRKVHALGKSPVVEWDGAVLAESGAILETLAGHFAPGRLAPAVSTPEALRYRYWMHYAEGSAMPPLLLKLVFNRVGSAPMPFFVRPVVKGVVRKVLGGFVQPQIEQHLDYQEAALQQLPWFAGAQFTAADIQMSFPVEAARARGGLDARRPRLMAWLETIHARPAYRRALERGGPYALLDGDSSA